MPAEVTAFLGAVVVFLVFLLIFYLYLSKKLCFYNMAPFPTCCDEDLMKLKKTGKKKLYSRVHGYLGISGFLSKQRRQTKTKYYTK